MAKIEMDLSEFDALRESKKLLKKSLDRERELSSEIKKLNEEKLKAYEDAKMKVIRTVKHETHEYVMSKRPIHEILGRIDYLYKMSSMHRGYNVASPFGFEIDHFINLFFVKHKTHSNKSTEEVTTVGLDEVKDEIRQELKSQIDSITQDKLNNFDKIQQDNIELQDKVSKLNTHIENLTKLNEELLNNQLNDEQRDKISKYDNIKSLVNKGWSLFNYSSILSYISRL